MIAASSHVLFFYLSKVYPNGYIAVGYFLFLQEQIKDHHHHESGRCDGRFNRTPDPVESRKHDTGGGEVRIMTCEGARSMLL
jgi:hypothetical protein